MFFPQRKKPIKKPGQEDQPMPVPQRPMIGGMPRPMPQIMPSRPPVKPEQASPSPLSVQPQTGILPQGQEEDPEKQLRFQKLKQYLMGSRPGFLMSDKKAKKDIKKC